MDKTLEMRARCTPAEYTALLLLARRNAEKPPEVLRRAVRELAQREGVWLEALAAHTGRDHDDTE